ncbi:MAG: segregation/condensation protein A [Defluviitaleaceae bacterium]|nr:segregation/condensation protein A [Defluviitaleaceae bacterium]
MEIKLDAYEGPMDLLVRLIQRNEIDIYDIPIAQLTAQYLDAVDALKDDDSYDMDQMSEFVLMAATLLEIKSRMLLPKPKVEAEDVEVEDPREALVRKIIAYQEAQALAAELTRISPPGLRLSGSGDPRLLEEVSADIDSQTPIMEGVGLDRIWEIFTDVMSRRAAKRDQVRAGFGQMQRERFTVPEKIAYIHKRMEAEGSVRLSLLFDFCRSRNEMIVTFLALLEMIRRGMMKARQDNAFEDVYCEAA